MKGEASDSACRSPAQLHCLFLTLTRISQVIIAVEVIVGVGVANRRKREAKGRKGRTDTTKRNAKHTMPAGVRAHAPQAVRQIARAGQEHRIGIDLRDEARV
jgi:hypothetical protein